MHDHIRQINEEQHRDRMARYPRVYREKGKTIYSMNPNESIYVYCEETPQYQFYKNGELHNLYGPAYVDCREDGHGNDYFIHGQHMTKNTWEFWRRLYV